MAVDYGVLGVSITQSYSAKCTYKLLQFIQIYSMEEVENGAVVQMHLRRIVRFQGLSLL